MRNQNREKWSKKEEKKKIKVKIKRRTKEKKRRKKVERMNKDVAKTGVRKDKERRK